MAKCLWDGCHDYGKRLGNCVKHYHRLRRLVKRTANTSNPITWGDLVAAGKCNKSRQSQEELDKLEASVRRKLAKLKKRRRSRAALAR